MKATQCVPQKISKLMIGSIMLAVAAALVVIGVTTLLPVFGFVLAIPVTALAIYTFRLHLNDQCKIDFTDK